MRHQTHRTSPEAGDFFWRHIVKLARLTVFILATSLILFTVEGCGSKKKRDHKQETQVVVAAQNDAPVANAGNDQAAFPREILTFNGSSSTDDVGVVSWFWDFDNTDGAAQKDAEGAVVTHQFMEEGEFFVTLTVKDKWGLYDRDTVRVLVEGDPDLTLPVAVITGDTEIMEGDVAHFDASDSSDDIGIRAYRWDFDDSDGFQTQLVGKKGVAQYPWPGVYTVTLEVEDLAGNKGIDTVSINVISDNAPNIVITDPVENMLLEGDVSVSGIAWDDGNITLIEIKVNDGPWLPATETSANWGTWEFDANVSRIFDAFTGRYYRQVPLIVARGTDSDGNTGKPMGLNEFFANAVYSFIPAPGEFVNNPNYSDPEVVLGAPYVNAIGSDPGEEVSLGGFGGSIVFRFYKPLINDPDNPLGKDLIVYGNAFATNGDGTKVYKEPGYVEVMEDTNGNGLPDDKWHLIPGSHLNPPITRLEKTWTMSDKDYPLPTIYPDYPTSVTMEAFELPAIVLLDPTNGYVDSTPMYPEGDGRSFNTPDDPDTPGVDEGSCGGDAIDLEGAVDPDTGAPASITQVDFIRIVNGLDIVDGSLGRKGPELKGAGGGAPPRPNPPSGD